MYNNTSVSVDLNTHNLVNMENPSQILFVPGSKFNQMDPFDETNIWTPSNKSGS